MRAGDVKCNGVFLSRIKSLSRSVKLLDKQQLTGVAYSRSE